jgi:hypothetical protein
LVVDTEGLMNCLRDQPLAVAFLEGVDETMDGSSVTVAQLYVSACDGEERDRQDAFIQTFDLAPLTQEAAVLAGATLVSLSRRHLSTLIEVLVLSVKA